jgi:hypothetical protein
MPKHNHNWLSAGEKIEGNQRVKFYKCNYCGVRTMKVEKITKRGIRA